MRRLGFLLLVAVLAVAPPLFSASAATQSATSRVSVSSSGAQATGGDSSNPSVTSDGRFVAFQADATNLVSGDTNGRSDVFVRDRTTGETTRVSLRSNGGQALLGDSYRASISADGRYVAFTSEAPNLVTGDTNGFADVFVHDCNTGETTRVSVDRYGTQAKFGDSDDPAISADGRYVAFQSDATNLDPITPDVPGDTNGHADVFVHDRETGETTRMSVDDGNAADGDNANGGSYSPSTSADGRYVAFRSDASDLLPVGQDTNVASDIYVRDRESGTTTRVSVRTSGSQVLHDSFDPSISADGRYVAFSSWDEGLVSGDSNFDEDVFVHDRGTGETTRVSIRTDGSQAVGDSYGPSISPDGHQVAFLSVSQNLVPADSNNAADIFVHDRTTHRTTRASLTTGGGQSNDGSYDAAITAGGGRIAFESEATNLVSGDSNGQFDVFVHIPPTQVSSTYGASRYDTAVEISRLSFPDGLWANDDGKRTVIVARGDLWPDSLAGGGLAGAYRGPILLTLPTLLPDTVMNEIGRLRATDAIILGGTGAVDPAVEQALAGKLGADHVTRLGGATRYETSELIAKAIADAPGSRFDGTAIVATGLLFPDSLAGSPMAAANHWPVFLAPPGGLTLSTQASMRDLGVTDAIVLGGTGAVPQAVEDGLEGALPGNVTRIGGANRYETATLIGNFAVSEGSIEHFFRIVTCVATGETFPDALAGGAYAGKLRGVLMLTRGDSLPPSTADALAEHKEEISQVIVFGGPGAVSDHVRDAIAGLME